MKFGGENDSMEVGDALRRERRGEWCKHWIRREARSMVDDGPMGIREPTLGYS
jgi:hypothetical protein